MIFIIPFPQLNFLIEDIIYIFYSFKEEENAIYHQIIIRTDSNIYLLSQWLHTKWMNKYIDILPMYVWYFFGRYFLTKVFNDKKG